MESAAPLRPPLFVAQLPPSKPGQRRIKRVCIANRGEIACRIIATCRKLNLVSIALYVDEDARSRHVSEADESICLGSISQDDGNPFLNVKLLVDTVLSARVDAIHPGYGYLSENEAFADAVRQAGMIFVGPSPQAIATLGDKRQSKEYLKKHAPNIPLVPGFAGSSQNSEDLQVAAEVIGYPVMLKASAGGGGRGIRIVRDPAKLKEDLERAQSEAKRSFGSTDCILEKYIESAKHIEVQIIGDSHGKVLSLWERECSVQRRHQKVIEETPSPFLTPEQRRRMCAAAVELGELLLYEGAGTVEFVVDAKDGSFYFLEVNTRLQVEHPITEEVTGLDIVALQLFVAAGGKLSDMPNVNNIKQEGHAIECRLCAEDAAKGFMPENGTIQLWKEAKLAQNSRDVRYETAIENGAAISIYFDSMIAKVVVWAPTRELAIARMVKVMANTACVGLKTNQLFLQSCLLHPAFHLPTYTTSLIPDNLDELLKNPYTTKIADVSAVLAVVPALLFREDHLYTNSKPFRNVRKAFKNQASDPANISTTVVQTVGTMESSSPLLCVWSSDSVGSPNNASNTSIIPFLELESPPGLNKKKMTATQEVTQKYTTVSRHLREGAFRKSPQYRVELRKWQPTTQGDTIAALLEASINGAIIHAWVTAKTTKCARASIMCHFPSLGTWIEYHCSSLLSYFEELREASIEDNAADAAKTIRAPMPCKVLSVLKKDGDQVTVGETVLVIESMKMETSIASAVHGAFHTSVSEGDAIDDGKVLCWFD